ncbi:hypothetical protein AVEN_256011-1 [Araneus ventricosus]|uniref:Uncharacterized protein n=1 Tax=Araneus ventricosus TaxID=182803 RepID=A0A4Y2RZQ2_ARAVE|nr:hypothetical protein AVEN_256011-1 [Araneus ventricosus]
MPTTQGEPLNPKVSNSSIPRYPIPVSQGIVTVMESRFPAMQVLWLGRGFYKVTPPWAFCLIERNPTFIKLAFWQEICTTAGHYEKQDIMQCQKGRRPPGPANGNCDPFYLPSFQSDSMKNPN